MAKLAHLLRPMVALGIGMVVAIMVREWWIGMLTISSSKSDGTLSQLSCGHSAPVEIDLDPHPHRQHNKGPNACKGGKEAHKIGADKSTIWGNLSWLAERMNTVDPDNLTNLGFLLQEWVTLKPGPINLGPGNGLPPPPAVNCSEHRYSGVLSGRPRAQSNPRTIIDFVPVGNDLDILEIRLMETFAVVDVFVVYEAELTQTGLEKPLFLTESIAATNRWDRFRSKLLVLVGTKSTLAHQATETINSIRKNNGRHRYDQHAWALEHSMRTVPVAQLAESNHSLAKFVREATESDAVALQNNADEISSGVALAHLKWCEIRSKPPYYMPASLYKGNVWTTVMHDDLKWLGTRWQNAGMNLPQAYVQSLWRPGPTVNLLLDVLIAKTTELGRSKVTDKWPDFGPGAAIHLSSPADPAQLFLKTISVIEGDASLALPAALREAVRVRGVTPTIISSNLVQQQQDWCGKNSRFSHVASFSMAHKARLRADLPWPLRTLKDRYPCLTTQSSDPKNRTRDCHPPVCFTDSSLEPVSPAQDEQTSHVASERIVAAVANSTHNTECLLEQLIQLEEISKARIRTIAASLDEDVAVVRAGCSHHKTGGLLFRALAPNRAWRRGGGDRKNKKNISNSARQVEIWWSGHCQPINESTGNDPDTVAVKHPHLPSGQTLHNLGDSLRLIHVVRLPVEMVLSGYFYHKARKERWISNPKVGRVRGRAGWSGEFTPEVVTALESGLWLHPDGTEVNLSRHMPTLRATEDYGTYLNRLSLREGLLAEAVRAACTSLVEMQRTVEISHSLTSHTTYRMICLDAFMKISDSARANAALDHHERYQRVWKLIATFLQIDSHELIAQAVTQDPLGLVTSTEFQSHSSIDVTSKRKSDARHALLAIDRTVLRSHLAKQETTQRCSRPPLSCL